MVRDAWSFCRFVLAIALAGSMVACGTTPPDDEGPLFTLLSPEETGIQFSNDLTPGPVRNVFTYTNFYNGGGVAIGDLTGNGRPDLYLTANQKSDQLYLNQGDFQFRNVTEEANLIDQSGWATGVTMADVNGDGRLDIYVSRAGWMEEQQRRNKLYVNQGVDAEGVPQFEERAAAYGIDSPTRTVHATFFDYDRDGDLDLYLLTHATGRVRGGRAEKQGTTQEDVDGDKLYRNDGGEFVDVTEDAGIVGAASSYGLSVTVSDLNRDGWPDMYVANDFIEDDRLYINQGDGTFEDQIRSRLDHISYSSMGADIADYTNDGWPDIYTLDMLAEGNRRQKTLIGPGGREFYRTIRSKGHYRQYQRNMLHRNNRNGTYSEIGQLAGVSNTDWSWAALFSDYDLDGHKDLYVTNGFRRDYTDLDYHQSVLYTNPNYMRFLRSQDPRGVDLYGFIQQMPSTPIANYAFRNRGDLTFETVSERWGLSQKGFSSGAAYGDLNNDGAPDLVVNNVDAKASVYRNNARRQTDHHYLTVELDGTGQNRFGIGARVEVSTPEGRTFSQQLMPARGFQSSVEPALHFGVGTADTVSVTVSWPDQTEEHRAEVAANQTITLDQRNARPGERTAPSSPDPFAREVAGERGLAFAHNENSFDDFRLNPLLPHKHSRLGPALARGDVTGNGKTDLFVGGARGQASVLFLQREDGSFEKTIPSVFEAHSQFEDVDAAFVDLDSDGDQELYVVSGGMAARKASDYQDRVYENDGTGQLRYAPNVVPRIRSSGGAVAVHDFSGDGRPDLFVGGRVAPTEFPTAPRSYLLENVGGRLEDVTAQVAPALSEPGMITDALWHDLTGDDTAELLLAGEWMPIRAFRFDSGGVREVTEELGFAQSSGWWYTLAVADLNGDGADDLIAGNRGRNAQVQAEPEAPAGLYAADFARDGSMQAIMTRHLDGNQYPVYWRSTLTEAIPPFDQRFESHEEYATATMDEILTDKERKRAETYEASVFETSVFENTKDGTFRRHALPNEVQFAPIHGLVVRDMNQDDRPDLVLAGNDFTVRAQWGRADAEKGTVLVNEGDFEFAAVQSRESGFYAPQDVRGLTLVPTDPGPLIVVGTNDAVLTAFAAPSTSSLITTRKGASSKGAARP